MLQPVGSIDVVSQLRSYVGANCTKVVYLLREIDEDGKGSVNRAELRSVLSVLGLQVTRADADAFVDTLVASDGQVHYNELHGKLGDADSASEFAGDVANRIELVSLNAAALRGGILINNISSVLGVDAVLNFGSTNDTSISEQLRDALGRNLARVVDLFHEWDVDGDGLITRAEFRKALNMLGVRASAPAMDALFDEFDVDGSGRINYHELHRQLRRRTDDVRQWATRRNGRFDAPLSATKTVHLSRVAGGVIEDSSAPEAIDPTLLAALHDAYAITPAAQGMALAKNMNQRRANEKIGRKLTPSALSLARAESVLLGLGPTAPEATVEKSKARLGTLKRLTERHNQIIEHRAQRLEVEARRLAQAEARARQARSNEAKLRQSAAICAVRFGEMPSSMPDHMPDDNASFAIGLSGFQSPESNAAVVSDTMPTQSIAHRQEALTPGSTPSRSLTGSASMTFDLFWRSTGKGNVDFDGAQCQSVSLEDACFASTQNLTRSSLSRASSLGGNGPSKTYIMRNDAAMSTESISWAKPLGFGTLSSGLEVKARTGWVASLRRSDKTRLPPMPLPPRAEAVRAGLRRGSESNLLMSQPSL